MSDVAIIGCRSYDSAECRASLEEAVSNTGGIDFIKKGTRVVIKTNLVAGIKPEKAATTHPAMLCALVDMIAEKGADVVVGDSPGGIYNSVYVNRIYSIAGVREVEKHGARLNQNFSQSAASFPGARVAKSFFYTSYLDDADCIIDFCKLKSHGMMGMSAGAKNMFGVVPGIIKPEYHYKYPNPKDFAGMIIDLNDYFKPVLTICDAVEGMEGNGPTAGTPRHIGAVIASRSQHKLDLLCAKLIGFEKEDILTLQEAYERGYIPEKCEMLDIYGDYKSFIIPDYKIVTSNRSLLFKSNSKTVLGKLTGRVVARALKSEPTLKKSECVGCGECFRVCPAKAIIMVNKKPVIDRSKCIACFCCQEFCPKGAMKVKRTLIARVLGGVSK
ncbi:MAG: DUF362 domain-containing protein [Eubacteriales bacterium]|nr:DUF362 domain-containing protein [Eubacteriales bacterium]